MIKYFIFGKYLISAIEAYNSANYLAADSMLNKALLINKTDFTAQFWKMRTAVMQQQYEIALHLIDICEELKCSLEIKKLLKPWKQICINQLSQTLDNNQYLITLNNETNDLLEYYQHNRTFNFLDCLYAVLLYLAISICTVVIFLIAIFIFTLPHKSVSPYYYLEVVVLYAPIITFYYYRKVTIIPNIYVSIHYIFIRIRKIFHSINFILICICMVFFMLSIFKNKLHIINIPNNIIDLLKIIWGISFTPIWEEIAIRGFLYGYLQKYGKIISWIIVTLIFYITHGQAANYWHVILSVLCLKVYDNEKTILAPILIHTLNNMLALFM